MKSAIPRVLTIPSDECFLEVLARAVLEGFPGPPVAKISPFELACCRILVPTRRAARELEQVFFELNRKAGVLLPQIRPIGDADEELFELAGPTRHNSELLAANPISTTGRDFLLMELIGEWAAANPQLRLAGEILASPRQALSLSLSLADLIDSVEIEEIDLGGITELYGLESARHREAILNFLSVARERLPALFAETGTVSPAARRSLLLRREAARLSAKPPAYPVIAAGSTGSIPATRQLLKAISLLPRGAVILPGLDQHMDEESWDAVTPQHPQYIMKQLLAGFAMKRQEVAVLPKNPASRRSWLASEIMRPTATAAAWEEILNTRQSDISRSLEGLELIEAPDIHMESRVIALILRQSLEHPGTRASLVTPDRELARRVKQELRAFGIEIDDSAGEPLIRFDGASLLAQLLAAALEGFTGLSLMALLKHRLCDCGFAEPEARQAISTIDLALYRSSYLKPGIGELPDVLAAAQQAIATDEHSHPALLAISEEQWNSAIEFATAFAGNVGSLLLQQMRPIAEHISALVECAQAISGNKLWQGETGETLHNLFATLNSDASRIKPCSFARAAAMLQHYLAATPFRSDDSKGPRLSIMGLLEARLTRSERLVLGGLNEGRWPAMPESGPWLNRPMRDKLGMQQPERRIGQAAHDLVQCLGAKEVFLVWSRRLADAPAIPSRWTLRLQMLLKAAGFEDRLGTKSLWLSQATKLNEVAAVKPCGKPRPKPPREARPKKLSVTRIETLIRDPYAIYASEVLALKPFAQASDLALRGTLYHRAIADFLSRFPKALPVDALDQLKQCGRQYLAPLAAHTDVGGFWAAQFERIAEWLVKEEQLQRRGVKQVVAEASGRLELLIEENPFLLVCRADRIDILEDGAARIVDYKTGTAPTAPQVKQGLSPQLTLQAAMLEQGAIAKLGRLEAQKLGYVKLGIGEPPGAYRWLDLKEPAIACARRHMAGLVALLTDYADQKQPYLPRTLMEKEEDTGDFDHLSRYREWALSGESR